MFFDRKRIKAAAKAALKRRHWLVVGAVLIVTLLGGTFAGTFRASSSNINLDLPTGSLSDTNIDLGVDGDTWLPDNGSDNPWNDADDFGNSQDFSWGTFWAELQTGWQDFAENLRAELGFDPTIFFGIFGILFLFALLVGFLFTIFISNPMTVGGHGWLMRYWRGETPGIGQVFAAFRIYKPTIATMLVKSIYQTLWTLLFIIPGIIKGFAYSMVPYIIYENPNLSPNQAITLSRKMTDGYKGDLFVFNLSFFGWQLLSGLTAGILGVLYVNPYIAVAHAGVYEDLKWKAIQSGRLTWEDFGQTPPPPPPVAPECNGGYGVAPAPSYTPPVNTYTPPMNTFIPPAEPYIPPVNTYTPPIQPPMPPAEPPASEWNNPNTPN